jgi:hypothetical protein
MNNTNLYPCNRINRRGFFFEAGGGFLGVALGALLANPLVSTLCVERTASRRSCVADWTPRRNPISVLPRMASGAAFQPRGKRS